MDTPKLPAGFDKFKKLAKGVVRADKADVDKQFEANKKARGKARKKKK